MTTFITVSHPKARFYVGSERLQFEAGHFEVEKRIPDEKTREAAIAVLDKLAEHGILGISRQVDFTSSHKCVVCQAGFPTAAKLQVHLKHHKSKEEIETETVREGDRLPPSASE